MKIRHLNQEEIEQAVQINQQNFPEYDFEKSVRQELRAMFSDQVKAPEFFTVEGDNGEMLGFAGYAQSWMSYEVYEMIWVNIDPSYQRQGLGKKLVKQIIDTIKDKGAAMIILYCKEPSYYYQFEFQKLSEMPDGYCVMGLRLK